ncbi:GPW/gp25 family protein [Sneathiella sp.]|jgi:phage baseplate assembly protein W|uniref:GPW/gp25 family protein n=1 Tax=Sneathiella sp. TaxID=1964365 RepID=UPI0039E3FDAA
MTTYINSPFTVLANTLETIDSNLYVQQAIEQVLFIQQGERVNRPTFGCGIANLVFDPLTSPTAGITEHLVQNQLQKILGNIADILSVKTEAFDAELRISVSYYNKLTGKTATSHYQSSVG